MKNREIIGTIFILLFMLLTVTKFGPAIFAQDADTVATEEAPLEQIEVSGSPEPPSPVSTVLPNLSPTSIPTPTEDVSFEESSDENFVLGLIDQFETTPSEIKLDENPPHNCRFEKFTQTIKRGGWGRFTFDISSKDAESIVKNTFFTGDLPTGIKAVIDRAASKEGILYSVSIDADANAQRGSFNIPVIYKETTNKEEDHTTMCQFNLIVE